MTDRDDFELKRALDALPRTMEPPAEAWAGVRAKIGGLRRRRRGDSLLRWAERFEPRQIRIAAGVAIIGIGVTVLALTTRAGARWFVTSVSPSAVYPAGQEPATVEATLNGERLSRESRRFRAGMALVTGAGGRARVLVGTIGSVEVQQNTSVRLLEARATSHRLALERGMIHAKIDAPPRLFIVETPAGTAIDMGCEYTLHVDSAGNSVLHVELGWVSFADPSGRESLVPAGFLAFARPGETGIGIPMRESASNQVRWAAMILSQSGEGPRADSAVRVLGTYAGRFDAVTLWHALPRVSGDNRARLVDALERRAPAPQGVTREGVLAGDRLMMRLWWEALPGTLPITPGFTKRLWLLWLKAASWL